MKRLLLRFNSDTSAATAIEYALIMAIMATALLGGLSVFGNNMNNMFLFLTNTIANQRVGL
jgi:pilus assembly protein Flp/PilA